MDYAHFSEKKGGLQPPSPPPPPLLMPSQRGRVLFSFKVGISPLPSTPLNLSREGVARARVVDYNMHIAQFIWIYGLVHACMHDIVLSIAILLTTSPVAEE